jgi:DNA-binding NarL/FixJ family response regulator
MNAIRVLIVDDAEQVRQGLRTILTLAGSGDEEGPIEIVGEATDGQEAVRQAEILQPEVILMDLEMPVMNGYEAARQIKTRCPGIRVIALTVHDSLAAWQEAHLAGIDDIVVKGAPLTTIIQAIRHI